MKTPECIPAVARALASTPPTYYECGICGHYHSATWDGDCREDSARFTADDLDTRHGDNKWAEITMDEVNGWRVVFVEDALALRRVAMQLHRWHERECGDERGGVERDEETGQTFEYVSATGRRYPCRDMETPALHRLAKIMQRYPGLGYYVQTDPRGASLYILRPGDVPEGADVSAYYSRGVAVYR